MRNDPGIGYLIDSDYVIDWLGGKGHAVSLISNLPMDRIAISIITYGEVFEGVLNARDPQRARQSFDSFVDSIRVIALDLSIMRRYARLRNELRRQGQLLQGFDLLIAATAIEQDLMLITGNSKHFARIPSIRLHETGEG